MCKVNIKNQIQEVAWEIYKSNENFNCLTLKDEFIYVNTIVGANLLVTTNNHKYIGNIFNLDKDYKEIKKEVEKLLNNLI